MFVDIVISEKAYELDRLFCYHLPEEFIPYALPGKRVLVPFGKYKKTEGILIKVYEETPEIQNIKSVLEILDHEPIITKTGFQIADFVRKKYLTTYFDALKLNMPSGIKTLLDERIFLNKDTDFQNFVGIKLEILNTLKQYDGIKEADLSELLKKKSLKRELAELHDEGFIEFKMNLKSSLSDKTAMIVSLVGDRNDVLSYVHENKSKKAQVRVLNFLLDHKSMTQSDLIMLTKCTKKTLDVLFLLGFIEFEEVEVLRNPYLNYTQIKEEKKTPTLEQKETIKSILSSINENKGETFLLHGVTGSGKTEVYLQVIEEVIKKDQKAIVLVPEISLTPQMVDRFFKRFSKGVAVIHSGLSQAERYDQFKMIHKGEIDVVIGARSAIFAPINNLGIIIVDEEHEQSYKSDSYPKYDAVEVAKFRASLDGATLVLSSATPSVVSYYYAKCGKYKLLTMDNRFNFNDLPSIELVDMRKELQEGNFSPLSKKLQEELSKNIEAGEQTILFLNRRGYSTFVSCRGCGYVAKCPHCEVSLTYHNNKNKLICHYCGYEKEFFSECPSCKSKYMKHFGSGTQKIEEALHQNFPNVSVIRMDADTTYKKFAHEKILKKFEEQNINILLGTQMVTKGLDFKNVTLSAVLAADGGLYLDDYRSCERTFSQITQVCGRSGRGDKKGRGIVQTYNPDHYVIQFAKEHNYKDFYETEIILRKEMNFPPFCDIINIVCTSLSQEMGKECIAFIYNLILKHKNTLNLKDEELKIYKPGFAPIAKIKNKYRFRILMKVKKSDEFSFVLENLSKEYHNKYKGQKLSLAMDINPVSLL